VQDALWLNIVQTHHESPDGSGYPAGAAAICDEAQLLRLADVFMAKVSPRAIRAAMAPNTATRQLFQQHGSAPLGIAAIRSIGVYPPGSLVLLKSGEVAVDTADVPVRLARRCPAAGYARLVVRTQGGVRRHRTGTLVCNT